VREEDDEWGPSVYVRWSWLWWTPLTPRKQNARFRNGTPLSVLFYVTANFGWYFLDVIIFE